MLGLEEPLDGLFARAKQSEEFHPHFFVFVKEFSRKDDFIQKISSVLPIKNLSFHLQPFF